MHISITHNKLFLFIYFICLTMRGKKEKKEENNNKKKSKERLLLGL